LFLLGDRLVINSKESLTLVNEALIYINQK